MPAGRGRPELSWQERGAVSRRIIAMTVPGYRLSGQVDQVFTAEEPGRELWCVPSEC